MTTIPLYQQDNLIGVVMRKLNHQCAQSKNYEEMKLWADRANQFEKAVLSTGLQTEKWNEHEHP